MDQQMLLAQFRSMLASKNKVGLQEILEKLEVNYSIPDSSVKYYSGETCLHIAAASLDLNIVKDLIFRGADLFKQETHYGRTPLHLAAQCVKTSKSKQIWETTGRRNSEPVINYLLSEQIKSGNALNCKNDNGMSHLHVACVFNHTDAVEFLIDGKDDAVHFGTFDFYLPGYTALHFAVRYSSVDAAKILLAYGVDIHAKDDYGNSPVHLLISRLMEARDFVNMGKQECCLSYKREIGYIESMITLFLQTKKSSGVNFVDDTGLSAIHLACCLEDSSSISEDFFEQKFDLQMQVHNNSKSWPGWTSLHFAACLSPENFRVLLSKGADVNVKNIKGESPLDMLMARYPLDVIHAIFLTKHEFKSILFSDESTNLLDTLLLMNDCSKFNDFLQTLPDVDISIPLDSPLFPGYTLIHLAVSLSEKKNLGSTIYPKTEFENKLPSVYNCTKTDEMTYWKRIVVCLSRRCSLTIKNSEGLTPIHLAFKLKKITAVEKLINCCKDDAVDPRGLSHLHIACAVGSESFVKKFLNNQNVNSIVRESFEWFGTTFGKLTRFCYRVSKISKFSPYLVPVRANSTPLHIAVIFERHEIVEYLLDNGADVYAKDALELTPIHLSLAASYTSSGELTKLLLQKIEITDIHDSTTRQGLSHLHVAAYANDVEAVEKMIEDGVDLNVVFDIPKRKFRSMLEYHLDEWTYLVEFAGQTPLQVAVEYNAMDVVKVLLHNNANIYGEKSPLRCVMQEFNHEIVEYFIRKFKRDKCDVGPIDSSNVTALHFACATFDLKWTKKLLEIGADVNAKIHYEDKLANWNGYTPLHMMICQAGRKRRKPAAMEKLLKMLLKRGADVTIQSTCDETPLHEAYGAYWACLNEVFEGEEPKNEDDVKFLLIAADLMLKSQKSYAINPANELRFTHFHYACLRNNVEIVNKFLDNGVDVNLRTDCFSHNTKGFTPLHYACKNKAVDVACVLVERGADVKSEDSEKSTPLHVALNEGFVDERLVDLMLRNGVDINAKNVNGMSILDLLIKSEEFTVEQIRARGWIKEN